jgi:hypothetical protein
MFRMSAAILASEAPLSGVSPAGYLVLVVAVGAAIP